MMKFSVVVVRSEVAVNGLRSLKFAFFLKFLLGLRILILASHIARSKRGQSGGCYKL